MKKLLSIIACTAAAALLSGCTDENAAANGTASETVIYSAGGSADAEEAETAEAPDTALEAEEKISETEEDAEYIVDEETDDEATDEDYAEPVEEPVDYPRLMQEKGLPANAKLYDMDDGAIPDMPEFTLSTDGLSDYERTDAARVRLRIKSILDCAVSGEVPAYKQNGYVWQSPQQLTGVRLNSWEIADEKIITDGNFRYEVTVTMDVAESDNEFVTEGIGDYLMIYYPGEDRLFLPLRKVGELDESRLLPFYGDDKEYLAFCNSFSCYFRWFFAEDVVTDFSKPDLSDYGGAEAAFNTLLIVCRYGGSDVAFPMSYEDFDNALKNMLGFSADAFNIKDYQYYDAETDTVDMPGRGTSWYCGYLADETYDEESGTRTVTIEYYEDDFYLVPSQTYRYTVRENEDGSYTMLKFEKLFTSDRNILGGTV